VPDDGAPRPIATFIAMSAAVSTATAPTAMATARSERRAHSPHPTAASAQA